MYMLISFIVSLCVAFFPFLVLVPGLCELFGYKPSGAEWAMLFFTVPGGIMLFIVLLVVRMVIYGAWKL